MGAREAAPRRAAVALLAWFLSKHGARADVYLHNPRGSNNKLSEQSNTRDNANRLFDSENNDNGGYQIGDNCNPVCQDGNQNYDETVSGAMQGIMTYYQGSELYIEWTAQHGCGVGHPNVGCQQILQYMCEADNSGIRDGTLRGANNNAGGQDDPPNANDAANLELGQHEPFSFYDDCYRRERNKGLYTADQDLNDNIGATATRQNPNGERHGLECPEERDYYPYWHPSPWHDIAIFTNEPSTRCAYYQEESENVKPRGFCTGPEHNNPSACQAAGAEWKESTPRDEPVPECYGAVHSRDNHLGNTGGAHPAYYLWRIPDDGTVSGRCVIRLRYNMTPGDFEPDSIINVDFNNFDIEEEEGFFVDAKYNNLNPNSVLDKPILEQDPEHDWVGINKPLQLQVNTNQYGRTFEDRTHTFYVRERPDEVPWYSRMVNLNVRGRRGNIVQVYPSVEYDFVPNNLVVEAGTFIHFQWVGSDANSRNNDGNGRQGTDRSNLVQMFDRTENVPVPLEKYTLLNPEENRALIESLAYLDQSNCDANEQNQNDITNCKQLNGASAYYDGGLVEMTQIGVHHILSTRNNDFSNRSHKATITVIAQVWEWYEVVGLVASIAVVAAIVAYASAVWWAWRHPDSWLFSRRYRPRIFGWKRLFSAEQIAAKEERRQALLEVARQTGGGASKAQSMIAMIPGVQAIAPAAGGVPPPQVMGSGGAPPDAAAPAGAPGADDAAAAKGWGQKEGRCLRCLRPFQSCARYLRLDRVRLFVALYTVLNVGVYLIGYLTHQDGFNRRAYAMAKGGGFVLDMNLAIIPLPMLKSLQGVVRSAGATREWLPVDDPIAIHTAAAVFIVLGTFSHIVGHVWHMISISNAPLMQPDPLGAWEILPVHWELSGRSLWDQYWDASVRLAAFSGTLILILMILIYSTALDCVKRSANRFTRRLGGYKLFWRFHSKWWLVWLLCLLHAPERLWIWLFFPTLCVLVDKMLQSSVQRYYAALTEAKLLPHDVMGLTFELPRGFKYEAGQYIMLLWRDEWHPFTLTSAPEDSFLTVHIRSPDSMDWCSALRQHLLADVPAAAGAVATGGGPPVPGTVVHYEKATDASGRKFFCKPTKISADGKDGLPKKTKEPEHHVATLDVGGGLPGDGEDERCMLPADAVALKLSGPHGAPAQKVWHYQTIMVVGSGIGITPFVSVLRSAMLRAQQRQAIYEKDRAKYTPEVLDRIIPMPTKIHFYWIVRSQTEFNWFHGLLTSAVQGLAKDLMSLNLYTTGKVEATQILAAVGMHQHFTGRPKWDQIFKSVYDQHKGEHIGVFLCGAPAIGAELRRQCATYSDESGAAGTRFSFFSEHF